jgi:phosphate acyltransferase
VSGDLPIALDVMGGDDAPGATIGGAQQAVRDLRAKLILVGPADAVRRELAHQHWAGPTPPIVDAPEVIDMAEHPVAAIRAKRHSSIVVGLDLVARGEAAAFVTAGNTGATMAAAVLGLKRIPGIDRPALAIPFPTLNKPCLLLDVGANAEARPNNLVEFAVMGSVYAEQVLGLARPRVALLSIGEEESKGSTVVQEAHQLLRAAPVNFVGNVEGKDISYGAADVIVMDGFVGNVLIKFAEGVSSSIVSTIRSELTRTTFTKLLAAGLRPAFGRIRRRMDYAEWGGAPLLGVNGVCVIGHGRSNPHAVRNAIRAAQFAVGQGLIENIRSGVAALAAPPECE